MTAPTTHAGGGICPLCRWAQDNGHPHPCITNPGVLEIAAGIFQTGTFPTADVTDQLMAHPAQPLNDLGLRGLRPVHRTWCFCGCSPTPSTPQPGAARS